MDNIKQRVKDNRVLRTQLEKRIRLRMKELDKRIEKKVTQIYHQHIKKNMKKDGTGIKNSAAAESSVRKGLDETFCAKNNRMNADEIAEMGK